MITITLQKICDKRPCTNSWETVLRANRHRRMSTEFPLTSVIKSNGLDDTLWCLQCLPEYDNLWWKYAVWCCRQVEHLMTNERSVNAFRIVMQYSHSEATDEELAAAWAAAGVAAWGIAWSAARAAAWVVGDVIRRKQQAKLLQILTAGEWVEDADSEQLRAGGE